MNFDLLLANDKRTERFFNISKIEITEDKILIEYEDPFYGVLTHEAKKSSIRLFQSIRHDE